MLVIGSYLPEHASSLAAAERPDDRFGMVGILPDGYNLNQIPARPWMQLAKDAGARANRWEFRWEQIQREPGPGDWASTDWIINENARHGMSLTGVLIATPAWASTTGRLGRSPPINLEKPALLADGLPNPENAWANFVYWTAHRYRGRVAAWELWNEPNLEQFWLGTPFQYYQLLKAGYLAARAADPKATVVMAGLSGAGTEFLRQVLDAIVADPDAPSNGGFFDVFSWHGYTRPKTIYEYTNSYRSMLVAYGLGKPIWIGETGVAAWDDPKVVEGPVRPFGDGASQEEQAQFVVQAYAYGLAAGVYRMGFYRASDVGEGRVAERPDLAVPAWGMVRLDGTQRPAYQAYQTVVALLNGSALLQMERSSDGYDRISFQAPGRIVHILFATGEGGIKGSTPAVLSDRAMLLDLQGKATPVRAQDRRFVVDLWGASNGLGRSKGDPVVYGAPVIVVEGNVAGIPPAGGLVKLVPYR